MSVVRPAQVEMVRVVEIAALSTPMPVQERPLRMVETADMPRAVVSATPLVVTVGMRMVAMAARPRVRMGEMPTPGTRARLKPVMVAMPAQAVQEARPAAMEGIPMHRLGPQMLLERVMLPVVVEARVVLHLQVGQAEQLLPEAVEQPQVEQVVPQRPEPVGQQPVEPVVPQQPEPVRQGPVEPVGRRTVELAEPAARQPAAQQPPQQLQAMVAAAAEGETPSVEVQGHSMPRTRFLG